MTQILAFVGMPSSGKDTAGEHLVNTFGARWWGHSDQIRKLAFEQGLENVETSMLSRIFEEHARTNGNGWIAEEVKSAIEVFLSGHPKSLVVVTGVRFLEELQVYRGLDGFQLVRLEADFEMRFRRAHDRQRLGEQNLTRRRFREIEMLAGNANLSRLMQVPAHIIQNNEPNKLSFYRALEVLVAP